MGFSAGAANRPVVQSALRSAVAATASFCTTLANGQYGILVLALLAASLQLDEAGWPCAAGLLAGIACLKPNITGPFLFCFVARRQWRAIGGVAGYLAIASLWMWAAIHATPLETLGQMMRGGERFTKLGYGPISIAIDMGIKPQVATPLIAISVAVLTLVLCVMYRRRRPLELFAVAGVAARFWTFHQTYDNLSVIFLLVALTQLAWAQGHVEAGAHDGSSRRIAVVAGEIDGFTLVPSDSVHCLDWRHRRHAMRTSGCWRRQQAHGVVRRDRLTSAGHR